MQKELRTIETENGFKKSNPSKSDILNALESLDSETNTFSILSPSDSKFIFCQAAYTNEREYYLENHVSKISYFSSAQNIGIEKSIEVFESINNGDQKWKKIVHWKENKKNSGNASNVIQILSFVGVAILIIEVIFAKKYKGSGIQLYQTDIELVYLFLFALWLMLPSMWEDITKHKYLAFYNLLRSYIGFVMIGLFTIAIIIETLRKFL